MIAKPSPSRVLKQLDDVIAVWEDHEDFSVGPDVTLKKLKETRTELEVCIGKVKDLKRQQTEQTGRRDDCARAGNQLVVRTRKGILAFFGPDSTQYAQAGGKRASERKRPVRKAKNASLPKAA
jgi:hypothetical protein